MNRLRALVLVAVILIPCIGLKLSAQSEGTATFRVTTRAAGQRYDPRHVLAIWVTDASNRFVKTLKRRANSREQYLYTWVRDTGRNDVDAVTGATISSHETHTVVWDGTDQYGNPVADGDYTFEVMAVDADDQDVQALTYTTGIVDGVSFIDGITYFLIGDQKIPIADIIEVVQPEPPVV